jgi:hypothetical protein
VKWNLHNEVSEQENEEAGVEEEETDMGAEEEGCQTQESSDSEGMSQHSLNIEPQNLRMPIGKSATSNSNATNTSFRGKASVNSMGYSLLK